MLVLKIIPENVALQIIFSARGNIRILAPDSLRERVCKIANKLLKNNK
jgi:hypothetical protein